KSGHPKYVFWKNAVSSHMLELLRAIENTPLQMWIACALFWRYIGISFFRKKSSKTTWTLSTLENVQSPCREAYGLNRGQYLNNLPKSLAGTFALCRVPSFKVCLVHQMI